MSFLFFSWIDISLHEIEFLQKETDIYSFQSILQAKSYHTFLRCGKAKLKSLL